MPNPELDAELENFAGTGAVSGFGSSETTIALSQLVELGGKRSDRLQLASLERDLGAWDYEERRIDVLTETTAAFIAVLAAQDQLALADELTAVADNLLQSIAVRVRAGASSAVEEMRARVSLETSQIDRARSVQLLSVARYRLSSMWGSATPEFSSVSGDLGQIVDVPELEVLGGRVEANPALARWSTEMARRQAAIELANSNGVPDLSVGAGMRHFSESGDLGVVVGLSLPLPLFDRNQGTSAAAEARLVQAEHEQRNSETSVRTALKEVHAEASASHDEIVALRERALPQAGSAFDLVSTTYQRGRMRLTDVFDAQRTLFELRGRLVAALARYHIAVAGIERLTGAPIAGADHEPRRP
jgi:cobalt-zinc-cadmium efflux system outer membrane protein